MKTFISVDKWSKGWDNTCKVIYKKQKNWIKIVGIEFEEQK